MLAKLIMFMSLLPMRTFEVISYVFSHTECIARELGLVKGKLNLASIPDTASLHDQRAVAPW